MKHLILICVNILIVTCGLQAQKVPLTGQISIHNSRYQTGEIEYVPGASVEAPFAGSTSSGTEGAFDLTFNGVERGTTISLTVEKVGLEIVNERDILTVILGRKQPLKVFLARKGELAERQTEFYDVSLAAITSKHNALITSLRSGGEESARTIQKLEQQFSKEFEHRYEAENLLREQLEKSQKRLPEMAKRLAKVNLDFASKTYRKAYEFYLQGDIQSALNILNEEELSIRMNQVQTAIDKITQGKRGFNQAIEVEIDKARQIYESYALKADAFELVFNYRDAIAVLKKGVFLLENIKAPDIEIASAYEFLASILQRQGKYVDALEYMLKAIKINESVLSSNDTRLSVSYSNIALVYIDMAKFNEGIDFQRKALAIQQKTLGEQHPYIAISYNNLASIHRAMGDYERALEFQNEVLLIQEENGDLINADIATTYNNLASLYQETGDYERALYLQEKAIFIREYIYGVNHPSVANGYSNLAVIYGLLGRLGDELFSIKKAISIQESILESSNPNLATSYNNISLTYNKLGRSRKALGFCQKSLDIRKKILNPNHPAVAESYNTLAIIYQSLKNYTQAIEFFQKSLEIRKKVFDPNHLSISNSYNNLAMLYRDIGDFSNALIQQKKSFYIAVKVLGFDHPRIAGDCSNLGIIYFELKDYKRALSWQEEALSIQKRYLATDHPDIAISYHNMSYSYALLNMMDSAFVCETRAFYILDQNEIKDEVMLELVKDNLFLYHNRRAKNRKNNKQYEMAAKEYSTALFFAKEKISIYSDLAEVYLLSGDFLLAIKNYNLCYENGGRDIDYLNNVGIAYAKWGKLDEAEECFTKLEQLLPNNGLMYRGWGLFYTLKGELDIALKNFEKAIELGYDNWEWFSTEESLNILRDNPRFKALLEKAPTKSE